MTELPSRRPGPQDSRSIPSGEADRGGRLWATRQVALDLARLLDEHATADLAATSKSLEEVNKLAHHRRLVLAIRSQAESR
jgi:hypothetical protein